MISSCGKLPARHSAERPAVVAAALAAAAEASAVAEAFLAVALVGVGNEYH